jgi:hypothetical protein
LTLGGRKKRKNFFFDGVGCVVALGLCCRCFDLVLFVLVVFFFKGLNVMWKKETNVFVGGSSNYLGFSADLKSNVFEAQQLKKAEHSDLAEGPVPVGRLELKNTNNVKKRSTAEIVNDAVESVNVADRLREKVAKYELVFALIICCLFFLMFWCLQGEGDVIDRERRMFEGRDNNVELQTVQSILNRIPASLPQLGHPDVERERAEGRAKKLATLALRGGASEKVKALLKE